MIFDVLLPIRLDKLLTYSSMSPDDLSLGSYVSVPLRNSHQCGIVWQNANKPTYNVRSIERVLNLPPMSDALRHFIDEFADYNLCPRGLATKGLLSHLQKVEKLTPSQIIYADNYSASLNNDQRLAVDFILERSTEFNTIVLDGVTGSGKTAVYMQAINEVLSNGGQALILLPEILLVSQLLSSFDKGVVCWHSSSKRKSQNLCDIMHGTARIIVGARSSLFLPYHNLKIIVVDEEHDSSYKQDSSYCYNARDMSVLRAKKENIPVVLSSATPSLETFHNIQQGKYSTVQLKRGYYGCALPSVEIVDMSSAHGNISDVLVTATDKTLRDNKQVLLFINRRGYCFLTICKQCGHKPSCPNCQAWLVEHKNSSNYRCHHCDFSRKITKSESCSKCGSTDIKRFGTGVERVMEEISLLFPNARIALISSDTMQKSAAKVINSIIKGEIDIIVGTQLLAKGHNFPNLATVGIIDADSHGLDLRVNERNYQALIQVSGRVGRYDIPGSVIIQTHDPNNTTIQAIKDFDREKFYACELKSRSQSYMPPFARLCCITISGKNLAVVEQAAKILAQSLCGESVKVLGPSPSPMPYMRKTHRFQIIVRTPKNYRIQAHIRASLARIKLPSAVDLRLDVDPTNFT